ncbi:MAG: sulfotransferase [Spirochaetota bacterium]
MDHPHDSHPVFICSTGRTGTQFLADSLASMVSHSKAYHEPGVLWATRPLDILRKVLKFGPYHMSFGQLDINRSMYVLSNSRAAGRVTDAEAVAYLRKMRGNLVGSENGQIYIESSGHLFGVLDLIPEVFPNAKIIYIVRDPRTWIASALRTIEFILYGPIDHGISVRASDLPEDPFAIYWKQMPKFERYAWWYEFVNSYVLQRCKSMDNFRVYRFEDLFGGEQRDEYFTSMLDFVSTFPDGYTVPYEFKPELLKKPKHSQKKSKGYFPWRMWRYPRVQMLLRHCRHYMEMFGYGTEPAWQEKERILRLRESKKRLGGIRLFYRHTGHHRHT